jgi:hypothetical protein
LYYINIHTATNPGGEIRGQLVPADILPTLVCPASTNAECAGTNDTFITLNAQVADTEGDALTVVWSVDGVAIQTNTVAAGASTNLTSVNFSAVYDVGIHAVTISVSDGVDVPVTCTATVTIVDTIPPTILSASLTPAVLWPPNHKLNTVQVSVIATDLCNGTATCRIKSIQSSQGALVKGSGKTSPDAQITGALTAKVRAERSGKEKSGRTYTIVVECSDPSGNAATTNLVVFVPHDQGNHGNSTNAPGQTGTLPPQSNGNGNGNGHGHGNH